MTACRHRIDRIFEHKIMNIKFPFDGGHLNKYNDCRHLHDVFFRILLSKLNCIHLYLHFRFRFLGSISAAPENITVTFLNPTSVKISWQTSVDQHAIPVDKYDVTYKPTDAR